MFGASQGIQVGDAVWTIRGDTSGLDQSLNQAKASVQSAMDTIEERGRAVGIAFTAIGGGILAGLGMAVKAASEAEAANAQLEQVIKSTGGAAGVTAEQMKDLATSLQNVTAYDDEAIKGAESLLLTFTNIGKDVLPNATKTVLDMSQALGQDLKSSSIQLGKALNDPVVGLTALQRVGVSFTEAQKDEIKALMGVNPELEKMGKSSERAAESMPKLQNALTVATLKLNELKEAGKGGTAAYAAQAANIEELKRKLSEAVGAVAQYKAAQDKAGKSTKDGSGLMKAQAIILNELMKEFGGQSEEFAKTTAGQWKQLENQFGEVKEAIGGALIPIMLDLAKTIKPWLVGLAEWISNNPRLVAAITVVAGVIGTLLVTLGPLLILLPGIVAAFTAIGPVIAAVGVLIGALGAPILIAVAVIGALIAVGYALYENWDTVASYLAIIWAQFKDNLAFTWDAIKAVFTVGINVIMTPFRQFVQGLQSGWDLIKVSAKAVGDTFDALWNGVVAGFQWVGDKLESLWKWITDMINTGLQGIIKAVNYVSNLFGLGDVIGGTEATGAAPAARAAGGPVRAGMPYLVGEVAPEIFVPKTDGTIVDGNKTRDLLLAAGRSGGQVVINVNGYNKDPRALAFEIARIQRDQQLAFRGA